MLESAIAILQQQRDRAETERQRAETERERAELQRDLLDLIVGTVQQLDQLEPDQIRTLLAQSPLQALQAAQDAQAPRAKPTHPSRDDLARWRQGPGARRRQQGGGAPPMRQRRLRRHIRGTGPRAAQAVLLGQVSTAGMGAEEPAAERP